MLIGISGKIGSGKDTIGKIIQYHTALKKHSNIQPSFKEFKLLTEAEIRDNPYLDSSISDWEIKKFADKLKDIVCMLIGCTREQLEDQEFKNTELSQDWWYYILPDNSRVNYLDCNNGELIKKSKLVKLTPRLLLQLIGTECGRDIIHPNIWVNALLNKYHNFTYNYQNYNSFKEAFEVFKTDGRNALKEGANFDDEYKNDSYIKKVVDNQIVSNNWIITDLRFPNEMKAVKERGGITIRVNRPKEELYNYLGNKLTLKELFVQVHKDTGDYPLKVYADEHWLIKDTHPSETALDNANFDYVIENNGTIEELIIKVKEILIKEKILIS